MQYKSGHHFYHLQEIANVYGKTINRMYEIIDHGKRKVDHVDGTAKVTVQWMAVIGHVFHNVKDVVEFLIDKYAESSTNYGIKEITEKELQLGRKKALLLDVSKVEQSSKLRVVVFRPGQSVFWGATRLSLCEEYKNDYGSCELFDDYTLSVG